MQVNGSQSDRLDGNLECDVVFLANGGLALEQASQASAADAIFADMEGSAVLARPSIDLAFLQLSESWDTLGSESQGLDQGIDS